jgi:transposase
VILPAPLEWRLGGQVVAVDPSVAFEKAIHMWLTRTAVSVDASHPFLLGNTCSPKSASASPKAADAPLTLSGPDRRRGSKRLAQVFDLDDLTGKLEAECNV